MRRRLVITSEGAGHHMRRIMPPETLVANDLFQGKSLKWWQQEDMHLFMISFGAFFTVFFTFIA
jgi:hypothetical protein